VRSLSVTFSGKYSTSKICSTLGVPRSSYYYRPVEFVEDEVIVKAVKTSFKESLCTYGTPRIREDLKEQGHNVSRLRIGRIMKTNNLVSCYTKKKRPKVKTHVNLSSHPNLVARQFDGRKEYEVVVSDTTYIDISGKWHYLCPMLDLSRRAILGSCVAKSRDTTLVTKSLYDMEIDLRKVDIFHTDRGSEFNSKVVDEILDGFSIRRSLSQKGTPVDNAVIESFFKTVKIEFINRYKFTSIESFIEGWNSYTYWYNYKRRHSSLGFQTPMGLQ